MSLMLDNYKINRTECCYSLVTLSALPLATRHWAASHNAKSRFLKWGHRFIAVIEACPILGSIAALIEMLFVKCLKKQIAQWDGKSILPLNKPILVTIDQLELLGLPFNLRFSNLPKYANSIFRFSWENPTLVKIVRIKNEAFINGKVLQLPVLKGPKNEDEGKRVRTFCLELLSNLEDQLTLQSNVKKIEALIQCVKYQLENTVFAKNMGFADYTDFLSLLMKEAPEYRSIFLRHHNLVELQKSLPKPAQTKASRWEKIRVTVRSGLLTQNLLEGASKAIRHGLRPLPPVPKRQRIFKLHPMIDAINTLSSDYREAGRWLMHQTRLITFREMCNSIRKSCFSLNKEIASWKDFTMFTISGKSQAWMADIAYRYLPLEKLAGVLTLPQRNTGNEIHRLMTQSKSDNFLIFDDGAYSCTQFHRYLNEFKQELKEKFASKKNLCFIFGHFPKSQYDTLNKELDCFKEYNVNIKVITHNLTSSWENDVLDDFRNFASKLSRQGKLEVVTEWKKPDYVSTSLFITQGFHCSFSRLDLGELNVDIGSMNKESPITDVVTPYLSTCE